MTLSKPTQLIIYIGSTVIGGYGSFLLADRLYLSSRVTPIDHNRLFDGIEEIPIAVAAAILGVILSIAITRLTLKRVVSK